jgi:hypothetical protein
MPRRWLTEWGDSCLSTQQKRFSILIIKDTNMARLVPRQTKQPSPQVNLITRGTRLMARSPRTIWTMKSSLCSGWHSWWGPRVSVVLRNVVGASDHLSIGEDHRSLQESCDSAWLRWLSSLIRTSTPMLAVSNVNTLSHYRDYTSQFYEVPGLCRSWRSPPWNSL